jgi:hypothetical protein
MLNQVFKALWIKHPDTGKLDPVLTLSAMTVLICGIKFLLDGASITMSGHSISLGHVDPLAYGAFLTPVLAMHSWLGNKKEGNKEDDDKN